MKETIGLVTGFTFTTVRGDHSCVAGPLTHTPLFPDRSLSGTDNGRIRLIRAWSGLGSVDHYLAFQRKCPLFQMCMFRFWIRADNGRFFRRNPAPFCYLEAIIGIAGCLLSLPLNMDRRYLASYPRGKRRLAADEQRRSTYRSES